MASYSIEENKELNDDLKKLQNKAKKLISNDYYDSVKLSSTNYSVLEKLMNAKTHYDINAYLWSSGMFERVLNDISDQLKNLKSGKYISF